jgi:hypothetical protein
MKINNYLNSLLSSVHADKCLENTLHLVSTASSHIFSFHRSQSTYDSSIYIYIYIYIYQFQ